ncbi:hypothetical protein BDZ89DRAFT_1147166 [Hymenopellis radicata]|nr:hypothetical protein BDZ89DRAFT_1147166 [Hymenopellis radicata]
MEGSICGIHASVYDPLYDCLCELKGSPLRGSKASLASIKPYSTLSITKTKKFRPCLVLKANPLSNYKTISLMATFGGIDYDKLADLLQRVVRPVQNDHPSFCDTRAVPVTPAWPKDPQWVICWPKRVTVELSAWSDDVPYSVDKNDIRELNNYLVEVRRTLVEDTRTKSGLRQQLFDNLIRWKKNYEAQGNGSIYSKAPDGSRGSLVSTRTSASSAYSTSTSSLSSIPEISEDDEPVATPTPTITTFAGKMIKNISKASRSSHFSRHNLSSQTFCWEKMVEVDFVDRR